MNYENRVVAFIDILGFRGVLDQTIKKDGSDDNDNIKKMIEAYDAIRSVWDMDDNGHLDEGVSGSKKATIFSDSIVVSFKAEEASEVFYTLYELKILIMRLMWHKLLCRGAVTSGKFIHTDEYLFGPALVEAYLLESRAALYPRVILDRSIIEAGVNSKADHHEVSAEEEYIQGLLEKDSDGMYYIDYINNVQSELDDPDYDLPEYIKNLGDVIRKGLMATSHSNKVDIRIKYLWMRERYNRMVSIVTRKEVVHHYENLNENGLASFYSNLKMISPHRK